MKILLPSRNPDQTGSALVLTMIMSGIAISILAGAMTWSASNTRLTHRSIQYARSVATAESVTEKVFSQLTRDFLSGGEKLVLDNINDYRRTVGTSSNASFWNQWEFNDTHGKNSRTFVERSQASTYTVLNSTYAGLRGFVSTYTVVAHAREAAAMQNVVGGVLQEVQLARIPIFQFAMYSSSDMEVSCGQAFAVTGKVHANKLLYVEPDNALTFQSDVTAVMDIMFQRHPLDNTRGDPKGTVVYQGVKKTPTPALTLPIGTTNTPEAIREIIQPPPLNEDADSPIGRLRYYNQAELIIFVSDGVVEARSGRSDNFKEKILTNEVAVFVSVTNSFKDWREEKTVRLVDINIGALTAWSQTNSHFKLPVSSVYVLDSRSSATVAATDLKAVRVVNGCNLPSRGLTVSTARPLYVLGNFNQANPANLGTTNTSTTQPASLVADAVTILSTNWLDANSTSLVKNRIGAPTTVNAAILTGVVETTLGHYSGGMENFPRFLETWGSANIFTYNGSMVRMFPSSYATNYWGKTNVYDPPKRNWTYDISFDDQTKLPPLTPSLLAVSRTQWATVAPDKNVETAILNKNAGNANH